MTWTHQIENETRGVREDLKDCFEEWRGVRRHDSLKEKKKYIIIIVPRPALKGLSYEIDFENVDENW